MACPNTDLDVVVKIFLDITNIKVSRLSKADELQMNVSQSFR